MVATIFLSVWVGAQMYGNGFGKTTFATSDGNGCYAWVQSNLPVVQDHPNGARPCGDVGRARLATSAQPSPFSHGFGIHAVHVNATSKRIHSGACIPIEDVEKAVDTKLQKVYSGGAYDAFMDLNSGHWVASLDPYASTFRKSNVSFVPLAWKDIVNSKDYFSLIARVHTSTMFIELMSADCSTCSSAMVAPTARYYFAKGQSPDDVFGHLDDKSTAKPLLHPAKVSWPTSSAARERKFLADGLGAVVTSYSADNVKTDVYDFTPVMASATMQFHVVERPSDGSTGPLSWADLEAAIQTCHNASILDDACGEDIWMDHHMGLAIHGTNKVQTDAEKLKTLATKLSLPFHVTASPQGPPAVYGIAGNGLSITFQVCEGQRPAKVGQGSYKPPRDLSSGMLDLCADGTCGPSVEVVL